MKGDFTRDTFDAHKHYNRVNMQQGRVQLDADWNEENSIILHYLQNLAKDLIGTQGGPPEGCGFEIIPVLSEKDSDLDFAISCGHYYVDGILCENDSPTANIRRVERSNRKSKSAKDVIYVLEKSRKKPLGLKEAKTEDLCVTTYKTQPDYPLPESEKLANKTESHHLVYLDVWERHITILDDPDIREVALGGADTCTRTKIVWQVKVSALKDVLEKNRALNSDKIQRLLKEKFQPENRGRMKVRIKQPANDESEISAKGPEAGYRGLENHLYRVEIHQGSERRRPTFKWSRENGSVAFPIRKLEGKIVTLKTFGMDGTKSLCEGDFVEIENDDYVLQNRTERLLEIEKIDRNNLKVFLRKSPESEVGTQPEKHALLRRWDHKKDGLKLDGGAVLLKENVWLDLENGIQVFFEGRGQTYRRGDYWLIPARTVTHNIEWPGTSANPESIPPHGVMHHYAPLAIISRVNKTFRVRDCRLKFRALPIADLKRRHFAVSYDEDTDRSKVIFGDGERGERLPEGNDQVSATYRRGQRKKRCKHT
jgi:hypothetical protein